MVGPVNTTMVWWLRRHPLAVWVDGSNPKGGKYFCFVSFLIIFYFYFIFNQFLTISSSSTRTRPASIHNAQANAAYERPPTAAAPTTAQIHWRATNAKNCASPLAAMPAVACVGTISFSGFFFKLLKI